MILALLYRVFYYPLFILIWLLSFINPKVRHGFLLRKKQKGQLPWLNTKKNSQAIWLHCSSGEYEYAKPVIRQLKLKYPQIKIMVTYFSPSVKSSLESATDIDFFCPTPWDSKKLWKQFVEYHNPQALLIARTDLWPHMLSAANSCNVPILLFSKTVNKTKGFWSRHLSKYLLKQVDDIFCVSEDDRLALVDQLKPYSRIHNSGDTRFEQCLHRLQHPKNLKPLNNFHRPIFVAGSTWPSDEMVLLPTIKNNIKDISFVIAPHEPSEKHLNKLESQLCSIGIQSQRYSKIQSWDPLQVLIIDQVGILADIYGWGQYAFVGGSMDRSVHSVMEPLAHGLMTFIGPQHHNNREALQFKAIQVKDMTPVQVVRDSDELLRRFETLQPSWGEAQRLELKLQIKQRSGASQFVIKWLENNCDLSPGLS